MAATAAEHYTRPDKEERESMATMRAMLQAMTWASQAKDAALEDLQRRLSAALTQAEQGRAREAALLRRAEKSEEAEEALASQMAEVEAEAFTRIAETDRLLAALTNHVEPLTSSQLSIQIKVLQARLQAAREEAAAWARRCEILEEEVKEGRAREAALLRRAEVAEQAEEALVSQMAELEAEAFTRITEKTKAERIESSQVAKLERRLAGAEEALEAVHARLRQAEEKNRQLVQAQLAEKAVTLRRKQGGETLLSLSLQDLAGFVKLKLWNPSSLALLTSPS